MSNRYSRQTLFAPVGVDGQARLRGARVVVIGCGALGSAHVEMLARAGVGRLRIVDRDFVEESNLQRQTLFTERDAADQTPKAIAASVRVAEINRDVEVEPVVADVDRTNVEDLIRDADVVLDATDNFATRYLVNDACIKHNVAWIYGAAVGSYGVTMTVRPSRTPCLRCIFPDSPAPGTTPTCDTAGVIMPIISIVAATQVTEALKLIVGRTNDLHDSLMQFDVWRNEWRKLRLGARTADCPACALHRYDALDGADDGDGTNTRGGAAILCGRDAVQITPPRIAGAARTEIDLDALAIRLAASGNVRVNPYLLRVQVEDHELSVFRDGRAIIRGTDDPARARSLYARYIGG